MVERKMELKRRYHRKKKMAKLKAKLAYNTVLSILRTLESKGYVGHEEEGRAHRYLTRVAQEAARHN